ncbi:MAG: hypothetical protein ACM3TU_02885 [Bacillota bacterium]
MRRTLLILIALIIVIGGGVAFLMVVSQRAAFHPNTASSTPNLAGQAIFTDGEYGFTIRYPQTYTTDYDFASFYHLPANWRSNALPDATGTPIIAIVGYRTASDHSYPRYFDAEVRIGASKDPKEIDRCEVAATDQAERQLPDTNLGGVMFKTFAFEGAGMMQYVKGVSYRVVRNDTCIAIEKLETGSSYRDDPPSAEDIPQATLDQAYQALDKVVESITFVGS